MRLLLLGGSNSVMSYGFSHGLLSVDDRNASLGATSSVQNIYELYKYRDSSDIIISESNINDIYNIHNSRYSKETVLDNIRNLYFELKMTKKPIVIVIMPLFRYHEIDPDPTVVSEVNELHISLADLYGFYLVDCARKFESSIAGFEVRDIRSIQVNSLHGSRSYMYSFGCNLRRVIESDIYRISNAKIELKTQHSAYKRIEFTPDSNVVRCNSMFTRSCLAIENNHIVEFVGYKLVGIETWSKSNSSMVIKSKLGMTVKGFNDLLSFNELELEHEDCVVLGPNVAELPLTETSVNISNNKELIGDTFVAGLLIKKMGGRANYKEPKVGHIDISFCLPCVMPYYQHHIDMFEFDFDVKDDDIDKIRRLAISYEDTEPKLSYFLFWIAKILRPSGLFLRSKTKELNNKIRSRHTN